MSGSDRPLFRLEITEEAGSGVTIRLHHNGRIPNVLAGIPKDVLRRATPWVWNSHERQILRKARSMPWQSYRAVRDTLLLERAKMVMADRPHPEKPSRLTWMERRRMWQAHCDKLHDAALTERVKRDIRLSEVSRQDAEPKVVPLENEGPFPQETLTETMRRMSGTALSVPRVPEPRDRSR